MRRFVVASTVLLAFVGCGRASEPSAPQGSVAGAPSASATPVATPCVLEDASTRSQKSETASDLAQVTDVRWDDDDGCPRVVFEFQGDHIADYVVEYTTELRECGSGEESPIEEWGADAFLRVRLEPSGGPDPASESGEPVYKGPRDISVDGAVLKHLKVICDFEAVFEWIVALDAKHPFTVSTFEDPARLVVDISQG